MALTRKNAQLTAAQMASAVGLPNIPAGCESALIQADTGTVRYTADGTTTPTASVGMRVIKDQQPVTIMGKLSDYQFIVEGAGANLNIQYQVEQSNE